jgi:multisubunit Na+/H+ antiporter MnhG subunit
MEFINLLSSFFLLLGSIFIITGAIGIIRMPDFFFKNACLQYY